MEAGGVGSGLDSDNLLPTLDLLWPEAADDRSSAPNGMLPALLVVSFSLPLEFDADGVSVKNKWCVHGRDKNLPTTSLSLLLIPT